MFCQGNTECYVNFILGHCWCEDAYAEPGKPLLLFVGLNLLFSAAWLVVAACCAPYTLQDLAQGRVFRR